jgi:hypothetical protein
MTTRLKCGVVGALLVFGCARRPSAPVGVGVNVPKAQGPAAEVPAAPAEQTCFEPAAKGERSGVGGVVHCEVAASRSYCVAESATRKPVIVQLGATGALVETSIPARTEHVAQESASSLRFLTDGKPPRWFTVDLSNPDLPEVSAAVEVPGLEHAGALKAFASDGARALVGRYLIDYATKPTRYYGETALYSVHDGKRIGAVVPLTAWSGVCRRGTCLAVASGEGVAAPFEVLKIGDAGFERLGQLDRNCGGFVQWVDGERWIIARPLKAGIELVAVDFGSPRLVRKRVSLTAECPEIRHAVFAGRSGVVLRTADRGSVFVPLSSQLAAGAPEALPRSDSSERSFAPLLHGALMVEQTIGGGMRHSPTDSRGIRRYYRTWSFDGRAELLRAGAGARSWKSAGSIGLPHSGEDGEFSYGFRAHPLVRPGFAAVFVDDRPGGESEVLVVGRPCRRSVQSDR